MAELAKNRARELCKLACGHKPPFTSVGLAAIKALLPNQSDRWVQHDAGEVIAQMGKEKNMALIGYPPFVTELYNQVGTLDVLELRPKDGYLHASAPLRIIPNEDVVVIISKVFVNGSMDCLLSLCSSVAYIIMLEPITPFHHLLFSTRDQTFRPAADCNWFLFGGGSGENSRKEAHVALSPGDQSPQRAGSRPALDIPQDSGAQSHQRAEFDLKSAPGFSHWRQTGFGTCPHPQSYPGSRETWRGR